MAWAMIYNKLDKIDAGEVEPTDLFERPAAESGGQSAFTQSPSKSGLSCGHIPVPLYRTPGYDGAKQQHCAVCKANGLQLKTTLRLCGMFYQRGGGGCSTKEGAPEQAQPCLVTKSRDREVRTLGSIYPEVCFQRRGVPS